MPCKILFYTSFGDYDIPLLGLCFCVNDGNVATHCDACSKDIGDPSNAGRLDEK